MAAWSICFQLQMCSWKILWRLQRLPSPFLRPPPKPHQCWIAGSIARGILPVITGNRFICGVQLCPQIYDYNGVIYTANKRANGSQDLSSCVSVCFPDAFFLLSLLGSWGLGFCWFFSAREAASLKLDCTRQEGRGRPIGSSDSPCLVPLIVFNLWAVGRQWLQHIQVSLGKNTKVFSPSAWKFCILNKKCERVEPSVSTGVAPAYNWWTLGFAVTQGFCCMKAGKGKYKSSNEIRKADDNGCLLWRKVCTPSHPVQQHLRIHLPSMNWWETSKKKNKVKRNRILEEKKSCCYE